MNMRLKKWILPNLPYVGIALFATKLGQAIRIAPGADFSGKVLHMMDGMHAAFSTAVPSFHPLDLCVGVLVAAAILIKWPRTICVASAISRPSSCPRYSRTRIS